MLLCAPQRHQLGKAHQAQRKPFSCIVSLLIHTAVLQFQCRSSSLSLAQCREECFASDWRLHAGWGPIAITWAYGLVFWLLADCVKWAVSAKNPQAHFATLLRHPLPRQPCCCCTSCSRAVGQALNADAARRTDSLICVAGQLQNLQACIDSRGRLLQVMRVFDSVEGSRALARAADGQPPHWVQIVDAPAHAFDNLMEQVESQAKVRASCAFRIERWAVPDMQELHDFLSAHRPAADS